MDFPRSVPKAPVFFLLDSTLHTLPGWAPVLGSKRCPELCGGGTGVSCHLSGSGFLVLATSNNTVLVCSNSTHSFHRLSMRCEKVVSELLSPVVLAKADAIL